MIKGSVDPIPSAQQLRERLTALKSMGESEGLARYAAEQITALEPLAASLEAFEEVELAIRDRLIVPAVQTWN